MVKIHEQVRGYRTGAGAYVVGRPGYPPEAVAWLQDVLGVRPGRRVLEVGAGTGKFVPTLRAAGGAIVALEPIAEMRAEFSRAHDGIAVIAGTAEAIPLPDGSVDAVVCAQAFHWFATAAALAEIRRVLAPGGMLGLVWNARDEAVPWVAALSAITNRHEGAAPRYHTGAWRDAFPADGLTFVEERHVDSLHVGTVEDVVLNRTLSVSFIAALPDNAREEVATEVRGLIARTPALAGASEVAFPYVTSMFAYRRT